MQFKHPEILYFLFLLLIPIIIHLFHLRRFKKVPFTNVSFLKEITLQTRKSSQIKKWLTLLTRLLLLAAIIFAFSQPYISNNSSFDSKKETVFFLDNSYSMQAKGQSGPLLQLAVQDLIKYLDNDETISIITNSTSYKYVSISGVKNDLIQLGYASNQLDYKSVFLKASNFFSRDPNSLKNFIFISDFQDKNGTTLDIDNSDVRTHLVQLQPVNKNNVSVDSLFISGNSTSKLDLTVIIKNQGNSIEDLSVSLYEKDKLIAKSSVDIEHTAQVNFTVNNDDFSEGKIIINDTQLQFDNVLYFSINKPERINVLSINESDDRFLKKVFNISEFNYKGSDLNNLDYSDLPNQSLIVLNELNTVSNSLIDILKSFVQQDGFVLIIPSNEIDLKSYNQLFNQLNSIQFKPILEAEKKIIKINFSHPLFINVFNNEVSNFQYPKVNKSFPIIPNNASRILSYEDGNPFLVNKENIYVFSASLNLNNSNFQNSPLIVPTLYNIGKRSMQLSSPYFTIGLENKIDVNTSLNQDQVLVLENESAKIIPQQKSFSNKVSIITSETPELAGTYGIK
ncbi:MAG: BatA domain-containing protein, partial [Bacteroidia bacterium]|nr:BatA domain-containing protein [Bacteroidia bacterium]